MIWDRLCEMLRAREVSVEDVSSRGGMPLRIVHAIASGVTWYGRLGYGFGRAGFNIGPRDWEAALAAVAGADLAAICDDFAGVDEAVPTIIRRYQGEGERAGWEQMRCTRARGGAMGQTAGVEAD